MMRSTLSDYAESCRIAGERGQLEGAFRFTLGQMPLQVIASHGEAWDHVSVSLRNRCPTWEELQFIRRIFFEDDEWVVQFSPPPALHINNHPYCLHLWRPQADPLPTPPSGLIGIRGLSPA